MFFQLPERHPSSQRPTITANLTQKTNQTSRQYVPACAETDQLEASYISVPKAFKSHPVICQPVLHGGISTIPTGAVDVQPAHIVSPAVAVFGSGGLNLPWEE